MKFLKKDIQKICNLYNLGNLKKFEPIKGGLVNYNFDLETDQGRFIIRILGHKFTDWKKEKIELEFKILRFLEKNKFPYEVPKPIINSKGKYISSLNKENFWVYKRIEGYSISHLKNVNPEIIKELAKALAIYHKIIKKLKFKWHSEEGNTRWVSKGLSKMTKIKPKNKIDLLALRNVDYFKFILKETNKKEFKKNILANHTDFDASNALFRNGKLMAIIDFDNIEIRPRISDIAITIKDSCFTKHKFDKKKMKLFLETYEKIDKLTKEEKEIIPYCILKAYCAVFRWVYDGMKKERHRRYEFMKECIDESKSLIKELNLENFRSSYV